MKSNDPQHGNPTDYIGTLPKDGQRTVITYTLKLLSALRVENANDGDLLKGLARMEAKMMVHLESAFEEPQQRVRYQTGPE